MSEHVDETRDPDLLIAFIRREREGYAATIDGLRDHRDVLRDALAQAQRALQELGSLTHMADFTKGELEIPARRAFAQKAADAARAALARPV